MRLHPLATTALVASTTIATIIAATIIAPVSAEARPRPTVASQRVAHAHRGRAVAAPARVPYGQVPYGQVPYGQVPYGYVDSGPEDPRYGYEEAPDDPNYHGPGAEVFAATKAAARDSGLLHELAPDAKVSATGIVVGGGL